jgi:acetyl-CoA acetyltransferase
MFKLIKDREVLWPVDIRTQVDGGTVDVERVQVRFKLMTRSEQAAYFVRLRAVQNDAPDAMEQLKAIVDDELAKRITGWENVYDADGNPVPFSADNLAILLDIQPAFEAVRDALTAASTGALAKN